jgi:hypothetical protein
MRLAVGLSAANTHDSVLLEAVVDAVAPVKGPAGALADPASAQSSSTWTRATTTRAAGGRCAAAASPPGSPSVALTAATRSFPVAAMNVPAGGRGFSPVVAG